MLYGKAGGRRPGVATKLAALISRVTWLDRSGVGGATCRLTKSCSLTRSRPTYVVAASAIFDTGPIVALLDVDPFPEVCDGV